MADRLDSWKEIASYLKRSVRTVTRWEREQSLPVYRHKTGTVYAYKPELDAWWTSRGRQIDSSPPDAVSRQTSWLRRVRTQAVAVGLLMALVLAGFVARRSFKPEPKLVPLTTFPGIEGPPSLSPDGNQVAFHRNGDIFVKQVDREALLRLTNTPGADEAAPAWSPDGRQIGFVRDGTGIFLISPLGGSDRKIAETRSPLSANMSMMAWTPDSKSLVITEMTSEICASLFIVSVETGEKRRLTTPPEPSIGDRWPAISPDGRTLAFARFPQDSSANIHIMSLAGGEPRRITQERAALWGLTWTPDGREVVFSSDRRGVSRLWRISARSSSEASPFLVDSGGEYARFPSFSRPGTGKVARLAYQRFEQNFDIRRAEMVGESTPHHTLKSSRPFLASTRAETQPEYSPDGSKVAFVSDRSGALDIWLCDGDGSNPVRRTSLEGSALISPRWSPDSRRLAFFAGTGVFGKYQNYVVDAAEGSPWRLSRDEKQADFRPAWSRDGRWIYFGSGRTGTVQIWMMPAGGGEAVQITKGGGAEAFESPDGRLIYYTKVPEAGAGLWSIPVTGGAEVRVLNSPRFGFWAVTRNGIYFIDFHVAPEAPRPVKFFNFQNHQTTQIGTVEKSVTSHSSTGFAVSPDSRWLLYTSLESAGADLMLVDNFR